MGEIYYAETTPKNKPNTISATIRRTAMGTPLPSITSVRSKPHTSR